MVYCNIVYTCLADVRIIIFILKQNMSSMRLDGHVHAFMTNITIIIIKVNSFSYLYRLINMYTLKNQASKQERDSNPYLSYTSQTDRQTDSRLSAKTSR